MFRESSIPFRFSLSWKRERETPDGHLGATYDVTKSSLGLGHPIPHLLISLPYSSQRPEMVAIHLYMPFYRSLARVAGFLRKKQFQIISSSRVLKAIFFIRSYAHITPVEMEASKWELLQMENHNDIWLAQHHPKIKGCRLAGAVSVIFVIFTSSEPSSVPDIQCEWLISACCRGHTYRLFKKHFRRQIILPVNSFILLITFN